MPTRQRPSAPENFQFISVCGDNVRGDSATRRRVRSHAQADYRRRHPPPPRRPRAVELDVTPLLNGSLQATTNTGPLTLLDASWSDPFATFPVDRDHKSRELWSHLYDGTCPVFRSMQAIGFTGLIRESIGLSQMLSMSCWHLNRLREKPESTEYTKYSSVALRTLQQRLVDPGTSTSDDVIVAVMAFATYAYLTEDAQLLNIHMNGLSNILRNRGGEDTLESNPALRIMLYWIDINGCNILDGMPKYPHPYRLLATRSKLKFRLTELDKIPSGESLEDNVLVLYICDLMRQVNEIITLELKERNIWREVLFSGFHLSPILHDLLSMPRSTVNDELNIRRRECFRLAAMIYITQLRGKFDIDMSQGKRYASKLRTMLNSADMLPTWGTSNVFLIWILTVGATCSCISEDLRNQFTEMLSRAAQDAGMTRFQDLVILVYDFVWCDEALGPSLRNLEERIVVNT